MLCFSFQPNTPPYNHTTFYLYIYHWHAFGLHLSFGYSKEWLCAYLYTYFDQICLNSFGIEYMSIGIESLGLIVTLLWLFGDLIGSFPYVVTPICACCFIWPLSDLFVLGRVALSNTFWFLYCVLDSAVRPRPALNLLCSGGRSWTSDPLTSTSQVLGSQACTTVPCFVWCQGQNLGFRACSVGVPPLEPALWFAFSLLKSLKHFFMKLFSIPFAHFNWIFCASII